MPGVPGRGGPPPKRSSQRRRRNKSDQPIGQAPGGPVAEPPKLVNARAHSALGRRVWKAAQESGQNQFYEATDWVAVELLVHSVDAYVKQPRAGMLASITSLMTSLLFTEGDRRRARLELERSTGEGEPANVSDLDERRRRIRAGE